MASMLETLLATAVSRPDKKIMMERARPVPARNRDLFELFMLLGENTSLAALFQSTEIKRANPRDLIYAVLGRWPLAAELAAIEQPYNPKLHFRDLVCGAEFRGMLLRRICDAYPEFKRMLFVRLPRCGGAFFLSVVGARIPPVGAELTGKSVGPKEFLNRLGRFLAVYGTSRSMLVESASLAPFVMAPDIQGQAVGGFPWSVNPPPYRVNDRLFTIVREPNSLIVSQVNMVLRALSGSGADEAPGLKPWRQKLGPLPAQPSPQQWQELGRKVLAQLPMRNPICAGLADGTARGALDMCAASNIEIAALGQLTTWLHRSWECEVEPPPPGPPALFSPDAGDLAAVMARTDQDRIFYDKVGAALAANGNISVPGGAL